MIEPYVCPICSSKSWHPVDQQEGYCNECGAYTRECALRPCARPPAKVLGNISVCIPHYNDILSAA